MKKYTKIFKKWFQSEREVEITFSGWEIHIAKKILTHSYWLRNMYVSGLKGTITMWVEKNLQQATLTILV